MQWGDIYERIAKRIPKLAKVYGVPRGGAIVAGLTGRAVTRPELADVIVDDIIDSGRTRQEWKTKYPRKQFVGIVDKTKGEFCGQWVHFPWEQSAAVDAEANVVRLLQFIGEDANREGLQDTPKRVVKAWQEMTKGYRQDPKTILARDFDGDGYDEMIVCRNIEFHSTCEHHMLPFIGVAHVGYIPRSRVVGLSKLARLVDCYAARLQIQEQMTKQIADALTGNLKPKGVAVVIVAKHLCMSCRGVSKQQSEMVTCSLDGVFRKPEVRAEFMGHCQ